MKPKDILAALSKLGINLSGPQLAVLAIVLPLVVVGAVWLFKYVQKRRAEKKAAGPDVQAGPGQAAPQPDIDTGELRDAWLRFTRKLPSSYRRSILGFQHFVLLGTAGSDKGKLVDAQTDWRHQMKQVTGDASVDPALPVYLASGAVIHEIPERYLLDSSERCKKALDHLWRPLYREKTPTVVVVVDVPWLLESTPDVRADLARSLRAKVNQLSAIRRKPVDVCIALTRMDAIDGARETTAHWVKEGMSARVPLSPRVPVKASLDDWQAEHRAQLPRALVAMSSEEYRKCIAFLRATPGLFAPLEQLAETLLAPDAMAESPGWGGAYLCSDIPGATSPLKQGDAGPGPDPRRWHLIGTVAAASAIVTYFAVAYEAQHSVWAPAADALTTHRASPDEVGSDEETKRRRTICEFTVGHTGILHTFPGFFDDERDAFKDELSGYLRTHLVERLRDVAQNGIEGPDKMTLRWRRTIHYLGVLHSYHEDRLRLRDSMDVVAEMTGLEREVIEDYLANTRVPLTDPVRFELGYREADQRDSAGYWSKLPRGVQRGMADGVLRPEELAGMKALATEMSQSLSRFEHDDLTLSILQNIDTAADVEGERDGAKVPRLYYEYSPKYSTIIDSLKAADLQRQVGELKRLISAVLGASIDQEAVSYLPELSDRLSLLQAAAPAGGGGESIKLTLAGEEYVIDMGRWADLLRDSRASLLVDRFIAGAGVGSSIFFPPQMDSELRPVVWNPLATEGSVFRGRAVLSGRYTRAAFERRVRKEVNRLVDTLGRVRVPDDLEGRLHDLVREEAKRYSGLYRAEVMRFLRSYELNAPSAEALRVALGQISSEKSTFDDFVNALDENTSLASADRAGGKEDAKKGQAGKTDAPAKAEDPKKTAGSEKEGDPKKTKEEAEAEKVAALEREADIERMLTPVYDALRDFQGWHDAVGAEKGAPELAKYKEIVKQLLADLTAAEKDPSLEGGDATLEKDLTPAGRAVLASLRGTKGSYDSLVREWVLAAGLTSDQRAPFLAPFQQLARLGDSDIETVVARVWNRDMAPPVREIGAKFPFDRKAERSALPDELTALFHPTEGKLFALFRAYVEPISTFGDGKPFRELSTVRGRLRLPAELYPTMNAAAALSSRLWDDKGNPRKLEVRIATVPFTTGTNAKLVPTVVYMNIGETSIFNFNQKPGASNAPIDWTKDENAQVGIQVSDVDTKETSFPTPLVAPGPYWRFYRLLVLGRSSPVKQPVGSTLYEWDLRLRDGGGEKTTARVVVVGDPWSVFSLPRASATRASR